MISYSEFTEYRDQEWGYYLHHESCPDGESVPKVFEWCKHQWNLYTLPAEIENPPRLGGMNLIRFGSPKTPPEFEEILPFMGWVRVKVRNINDTFAQVLLSHPSSIGTLKKAELGVIQQGVDGRLAISRMIADYAMSKLAVGETWKPSVPIQTRCPSAIHGYLHEKKIIEYMKSGPSYKQFLLYSLVFDDMCLPCLMDSYSGDNYGLDDGGLGKPDQRTMSRIASLTGNDDEDVF